MFFEEQAKDNRFFHTCVEISVHQLYLFSSFSSFSCLIPVMHSGKTDIPPSFLLR